MEETLAIIKTYTPAVKKAIMKYRNKHQQEYNEFQRLYYHKLKENTDWKDQFNARCRENNKRYREKKRLEIGEENIKPRGRPRKIVIDPLNALIDN